MTDVRALSALADVICRAQAQGRVTPMGIAFAIDAADLLMSPETAAELSRLREITTARESDPFLAKVRARHAACLGGGWHRDPEPGKDPDLIRTTVSGSHHYIGVLKFAGWRAAENREFVLYAHGDIYVLLAEVDRLRAALEVLREQLREAIAGSAVADELYQLWQQRAEAAETRVAELESERHTTNELLSQAAEQVAEMTQQLASANAVMGDADRAMRADGALLTGRPCPAHPAVTP